ncbi:MAG: DUF4886 domain-containing protein [Lachnospiraceae bacterium]|nr:DUF4886 domain-containing protein [Lachnospiraceae bacterium]
MKILAIGNSFSEDGTRYLYQIAKAAQIDMKVVNLTIGGCPLRLHFANSIENNRNYGMQLNGMASGFKVSIREALLSDEWDVVTIQQVSSASPRYETFQPYLNYMADYIRMHAPKAKLYLQQTWAYEEGSKRLCEELRYEKAEDMLKDIQTSYQQAAKEIHADGIIPSGEVMYEMIKRGVEKVHRDTFHAKLGIGRYAIGLTWYATLTGNDVMNNPFTDLVEEASEEDMQIARKCVRDIVFGADKQ